MNHSLGARMLATILIVTLAASIATAQLVRRARPIGQPEPAPTAPTTPTPPAEPAPAPPTEPVARRARPIEEPATPAPEVPKAKPVETEKAAEPAIPMEAAKALPAEDTPRLDVKQMQNEAPEKSEEKPAVEHDDKPIESPKPTAKSDSKTKSEDEAPPPPKAKTYEPPLNGLLLQMGKDAVRKDMAATLATQKDAPTVRIEVAAPRGQIVDRNGVCLAQNRMAYYLSLNFPKIEPTTDAAIIAFARPIVDKVIKILGTNWVMPDERFVQHYKDRRWLPMMISMDGKLPVELTPDQIKALDSMLTGSKSLALHPTYVRTYPKLDTACHSIGYTGIRQPLPKAAIADNEPFIEEPTGKAGLESAFENELRGKPGSISILFAPDGSKIHEEVKRRPVPGNNVVTTLDYNIQRFAEDTLRIRAPKGGAMAVVDVRNGDILALASYPRYDLNDFVPRVPEARYAELLADKKTPLVGRAFQGVYYPASTFKVVTALAGLDSGAVDAGTTYDCDAAYVIGDRTFHNWSKSGEGPMNVVGAIKRSCNTWFYQAALEIGTTRLVSMAEKLGFGQPIGIPLPEQKGFLPTDAYYQQTSGHRILSGMLASISIGQVVTATPLQMAQCMAAVADGNNMPKLRLVKQIQDYNDNVLQVFPPEARAPLNISPKARETVIKGMVAVVHGDGGTGANAAVSGTTMAGKTGTAQWIVSEDEDKSRWLAVFTGFFPVKDPVYAFAVVYEGGPGERVSGGKVAAPIVHDVFTKVMNDAKASDPIRGSTGSPDEDNEEESRPATAVAKAKPVEEAKPAEQAPPPASIGGFFKKLFGRK